MGIKNLNNILKKYCNNGIYEINYKDLDGKFVGIDTSIFLYKYTYMGDMLLYFLKQIEHLLKYNITPLYLFDGKPTEDKKKLIIKRKETYVKNKETIEKLNTQKKELLENTLNFDEINEELYLIEKEIKKKTKNNIKIDFNNVIQFKQILKNLGIFYYECNGETDSYIKSFFDKKLIDYVITEDLDFLTHGCKNVLYNYNFNKKKIKLYNLNLILNDLNISYESFVDMCIMLGCDYHLKGIKNIGPIKSYQYIKKYKSLKNTLNNENKLKLDDDFYYDNILEMFNCKKDLNINKDDIKINKNKLNVSYFDNLSYDINNIFLLIQKFKYKINILFYFKK